MLQLYAADDWEQANVSSLQISYNVVKEAS